MRRFGFVLPFIFLSLFIIHPIYVQAQSSKSELVPLQRLEELLRDLETVDESGRQILKDQDATIAEIENLKIWVRKR